MGRSLRPGRLPQEPHSVIQILAKGRLAQGWPRAPRRVHHLYHISGRGFPQPHWLKGMNGVWVGGKVYMHSFNQEPYTVVILITKSFILSEVDEQRPSMHVYHKIGRPKTPLHSTPSTSTPKTHGRGDRKRL